VLALGLPRCAITSVAAALESDVLGIKPVLHASETAAHRGRATLILDALHLEGAENLTHRRNKLHEIIDGHAACAESFNVLADDLMDMYPDAKIILNVRPPARSGETTAIAWAQSCSTAISFFGSYWALAACWPLRRYRFWCYRYRLQTDLWRQKGLLPCEDSRFIAPKGCAWMTPILYDRYTEWIVAEARKRDREVLIWHPAMGWAPLCKLFGKSLPPMGTPLPQLNTSATARKGHFGYVVDGLLRYVLVGGLICFLFLVLEHTALQKGHFTPEL
jgi:hypothetical protein